MKMKLADGSGVGAFVGSVVGLSVGSRIGSLVVGSAVGSNVGFKVGGTGKDSVAEKKQNDNSQTIQRAVKSPFLL